MRELRISASLKIEDVANSVQISRSTLNMYELGLRIPEDNIKMKLARFYGLSVDQLFFDNE